MFRKLICFLLFTIFLQNFFSQEMRVIYDYKFKIDSLNRSDVSEELMYLDIRNEKSYFSSFPTLIYDSILNGELKKRGRSLSNFDFSSYSNNSKVTFSVSKNLSSKSIVIHEAVGSANYGVIVNDKIDWKISSDTKTLNGIVLQKAETDYIGRHWVAWFSSNYSVQDGPYIFSNLPGLILELYDEKEDHHFIFNSILNMKLKDYYDDSKNIFGEISVSKLKFNSLWHEYKANPSKSFLAQSSSSNVSVTMSVDGVSNPHELAKEMDKNAKERFKKNNNYLNLQLFK